MKIKRLNENAIIPTIGTQHSAGADLYACETVKITPYRTVVVHTGLAMEIPSGLFGAIYARSGLATKSGLRPANCVGIIDSDYRGEIMVALYNDSDVDRVVNVGDRIAQIVFCNYWKPYFKEVDELDDTARGQGGFGSTGK